MATSTRPVGITIIAILAAILGVLILFGGLALLGLGLIGSAAGMASLRPGLSVLGALGAFGGVILLAWGVAQLYIAYGAWNLKPWAWSWLMVLSIIGAVLSLMSIRHSLGSLIIYGVIIYYLNTPPVRAAFGRA